MEGDGMIIAMVSGKGGVGKTSIVANLGSALARAGGEILLVDMDFFTRGLTFFLSKGTTTFDTSVREALEGLPYRYSPDYFQVEENLSLLPPVKRSLESVKSSEILDLMGEDLAKLNSLFSRVSRAYDYVLVDCRSGADFLSVGPALAADQYWIVTEEDRTSQRTSAVLRESVDRFGLDRGVTCTFGGFIMNMTVATQVRDLVGFFERTVFGEKCISVIPLDKNVRRAFIQDVLVIDRFPQAPFSREMRAIAAWLLKESVPSPIERASRRARIGLIREVIAPMAATLTLAVSAGVSAMNILGLGPSWFRSVILGVMLGFIPMFYLYMFARREW